MTAARFVSCLLLLLGLATGLSADDGTLRAALAAELSKEASTLVESPTVTGITMAVGKGDQILFAQGFGIANIETGAPVTAATRMRSGSVSKVMTTALLARLYEDGLLDLDAPIQRYVTDYPAKRWTLRIRDLAAHMGGVRHYKGDEFLSTRHYDTVRAGLAMFERDPLVFEPRTRVAYSSHAWNLISAALEGAGGTPFLEAMAQKVFKPLVMTETAAEDITQPLPRLAAFHVQNGGETVVAPFVDNSYKWAGGGFIATARDLVTFGLAHTRPGFLKQDTLSLLFKEQATQDGTPAGFGIGWMTADAMRRRLARQGNTDAGSAVGDQLVWHSGGSMGAAALLLVDPEHDIAVGLMTNHGNGFPALQQLGLKALSILLREEQAQPNPALSP